MIAAAFSADLDHLRDLTANSSRWLADLERTERARTGISTLKVGYNRVHGYYIETSRAASGEIPVEYVRRQTLKNAERYITPELKTFEDEALTSQARALKPFTSASKFTPTASLNNWILFQVIENKSPPQAKNQHLVFCARHHNIFRP